MRLNYYRFPEEIDAQTRFDNGAELIEGVCLIHDSKPKGECPDALFDDDGWGCRSCANFEVLEAGDTVYGISVKNVKSLIKSFGGYGWTEHCDRSGGVFEVTDIKLKGNNSNHHYNRHL